MKRFLLTHLRWGVVVLLFFTAMLNNLDRMVLSILAPTLKDSLSFGPQEYSYIVAAFLAAYAIGYTFCGKVLDRVGVKVGIMAALVFWSLAGMGHAAAVGWLSLAAFRFLLGLGESFNSPAGVKAIAEWVPKRERGLSMAVFSNGNVLGSILAPPLVAFLCLHYGWRWAFIVTGSLGLVLWFVWHRFYHSPENHPLLTDAERQLIRSGTTVASFDSGITEAESSVDKRSCWRLAIAFLVARMLTDPITYFFAFWLPSYLQEARGFSLSMIGAVAWIPFLASDVGGPGGGALSDWLIRRGWNSRTARLSLMLLAATLTPAAAAAVFVPKAWMALVCIALVLGAQSCWMANQLTLISESVPKSRTASLLALSAMGGSVGGILANLLAGRVIGVVGYVPVFCVLAFCHLMAWVVLVFAGRSDTKRGRLNGRLS